MKLILLSTCPGIQREREGKRDKYELCSYIEYTSGKYVSIMARPSLQLIDALRATATKLLQSDLYQWGHMGTCNCGFLAQQITHLRKEDIHARAMQRYGDWNEQLNDYCPTSNFPMDHLISELLAFGLDIDDLKHLERLSDGEVLRSLPPDKRNLTRNIKTDVTLYLTAWAMMLETQLLNNIQLPSLTPPKKIAE